MPKADAPKPNDDAAPPTLVALVSQLAQDTSAFARAELDYLKAQAGERASHALPGFITIAVSIILAFGAIIALLLGLMLWMAQWLGLGWAILVTLFATTVVVGIAMQWGSARIRQSLKPRDDR